MGCQRPQRCQQALPQVAWLRRDEDLAAGPRAKSARRGLRGRAQGRVALRMRNRCRPRFNSERDIAARHGHCDVPTHSTFATWLPHAQLQIRNNSRELPVVVTIAYSATLLESAPVVTTIAMSCV